MDGIPPALSSDVEDVVWALQTADALWKRNERIDAVVWLRRAAQAAGEADDDERAVALARNAAELSEWLARNPLGQASHEPEARGPFSLPTQDVMIPVSLHVATPQPISSSPRPLTTPSEAPSAHEVHAGMLDPWATSGVAGPKSPARPLRAASGVDHTPDDEDRATSLQVLTSAAAKPDAEPEDETEIITSARRIPSALTSSESRIALAKAKGPPPRVPRPPTAPPPAPAPPRPRAMPPPLPSARPAAASRPDPAAARAPSRPDLVEALAGSRPERGEAAPSDPDDAPSSAPDSSVADYARMVTIADPIESTVKMDSASEAGLLDLHGAQALADLPDDAREAFASAATVHRLAKGEETSGFALALVVSGEVDVSASIVDVAADRLGVGAVLRTRGTVGEAIKLRVVGASRLATVATWNAAAVEAAFKTCPWVEDDLRAASDRTQALVGITLGPLAERLDPSILRQITGRLTVRTLGPYEVLVKEAQTLPGLTIVGVGAIEIVRGDQIAFDLGPGDILFPGEVLGGNVAPALARAGSAGAILLQTDRGTSHELLVTCPPLLEALAQM